ncbi:metallo-beta-lactamase class B [Luteibacter sp. Sphag1AF]|uniref:subclass B3 metallo-beta-lactamase n=1 Tax=Luteibacter sp. Sphag1AF TaxID=2587031 RepID=UPI0016100340|nr:subclass B3 metallo-beta-lactamase [Luteibacter sp. Sphag1AF]MBB3226746.1 metallo-beta-lactamase class B [Luteibacter sp. Sphag1AF]
MLIARLFCASALAAASFAAYAGQPEWTQPEAPFKVYGNTYYVGSRGLSAILVTSPKGHVLIDATEDVNAPMIEANVRALGFKVEDIRVILNSHAHADHAGAIAAIARDSGAEVRASPASAHALRLGGNDPNDPQFGEAPLFPPVKEVDELSPGETVHVGDLALTSHATPGHTLGGTTWTWRSCEGERCLNIVYGDSLTPFSKDGYRFSADAKKLAAYRKGIETVSNLPCDILITAHPDVVDLMSKVDAHASLEDKHACQAYAVWATGKLDARLAKERAAH